MDLLYAIKSGSKEKLEKLLQETKNIDTVIRNQYTPLMYACKYKKHDIIKILIENKADVNFFHKGNYPLASALNNPKSVSILLEAGISHGYLNGILLEAVDSKKDRYKTVDILIREGTNIDAVNSRDKTALDIAIENKLLNSAKVLFNAGCKLTININEVIKHLGLDFTEMMLQKGISPNEIVPKNEDELKLMFKYGADYNYRSYPLSIYFETVCNRLEIKNIELLLRRGVEPNISIKLLEQYKSISPYCDKRKVRDDIKDIVQLLYKYGASQSKGVKDLIQKNPMLKWMIGINSSARNYILLLLIHNISIKPICQIVIDYIHG